MTEMLTVDFIKSLQQILYDVNIYSRQVAEELNSTYGWNDNDVRMYFFNASGQSAFLHGLTLNFIDCEIRQNKNQWREKQEFVEVRDEHEYEAIISNYSGLVRNNFYTDFFILLEDGLRIFGEKITPQIIHSKICTVKDQIINQLGLDTEYKKLFDIIFKLRNTIHNGGLHSDDKPPIIYKEKKFEFFRKKETQTNLQEIEFLFNEALIFMKVLFNHEVSKKVGDMEHPYKPLFNPTG